jgi:ribosome-interacting GTPase 1
VLGNRKYIKCIYCYNKIDQISIEEVNRLARQDNTVVLSCELNLNMETLIEEIWYHLGLVRIYTKRRGEFPDLDGGLILKRGSSVEQVCKSVHRSLMEEFKFALVWGTSAKHNAQRVGLSHICEDEDVIQIVKKRN